MAQQQKSGITISPRLLIALAIAAFSLISYFGSSVYNPITEQKQHLDMTPKQEIALGLQAAPEMAQQYGGEARDPAGQAAVEQLGQELVAKTDAGKTPYQYHFHLLADDSTVNAFALPGGQIFITEGLYKNLKTKGELAGVLAHEVGHVAARHSAQQLAKQQLSQGLTGAAVIAAYDPNDRNNNTAAMAMLISQVVSLKFGRNDELEADRLGIRFSQQAGYDPRAMIKVMKILDQLAKSRTPEFFSTHPNPDNRIKKINDEIAARFPNGVPDGLVQ
ncbi:M48 family metalloprotease [bacterium]|jgi:predicted Zn-dependent protease|nr:M48 family metalloprotease [bacterium]